MKWSFYQLWNESLEQGRPERELKVRENMWASELGGSMVDRYLKMRAVAPSNPPNLRSLRKFEAGNIWEWIVGLVLQRAGVLKTSQEWVSFQYPGLCEVTGKIDYLAGGKPSWSDAEARIVELGLPEFLEGAAYKVLTYFEDRFSDGLENIVLEIKSVSSFMFEKYEKTGKANPNHRLQLFHYLKAKNMPEGHIVYICKDDARMLEVGVMNPSPVEDEYKADIACLTKYIKEGVQPPLEEMISFDDEWGKFSVNWKVMYSNYLSMLYGFPDQMAFENTFKPRVAQWNRVLGRCIKGDKMTDLNLKVIEDIKSFGFKNFDQIVSKAKEVGGADEAEGGEE